MPQRVHDREAAGPAGRVSRGHDGEAHEDDRSHEQDCRDRVHLHLNLLGDPRRFEPDVGRGDREPADCREPGAAQDSSLPGTPGDSEKIGKLKPEAREPEDAGHEGTRRTERVDPSEYSRSKEISAT
jgi:hypothetical protein